MNITNNLFFEHPEFLWFLILLPLLFLYFWFVKRKNRPKISHSTSKLAQVSTWKNTFAFLPKALAYLALFLMIIALARPRSESEDVETLNQEGIDIVLALDVSTSMGAYDFKPNRLEASKAIAIDFVNGIKNDRIGLVIYAGESFTKCPITSDYKLVKNQLNSIKFGLLEDGTAIGMGLATSVSRLKDSKAKSKVIILLTDGVNNTGLISPQTAADLAAEFGIKVYTICVGKNGNVKAPGPMGRTRVIEHIVDVDMMKDIAQITGGKSFIADNNQALEAIYEEINALEKTEIKELKYKNYSEHFRPILLLGLLLLAIERCLTYTVFKTIN
ncbi:MAG: vWA domain-containing protein [Flavobacteriales bacterium]